MMKMKFTNAEEKLLKGMEQRLRDNDTDGLLKSDLEELKKEDEKGIFSELNEQGEVIISPSFKEQLIKGRRQVDGEVKLYKTLKRHFGKPYAESMLTLLKGRKLPWDVLLELNIEVDRRIASNQSSDTILQYLQTSATPNLLIERKLKVINEERLQAERETEAERQEKEAEKQLRIQAEQEAEKQKQEAEKQKQENTHLRQLLAQMQSAAVPTTSTTAQTTSNTLANNSVFWQPASTTANASNATSKKRELDTTNTVQLDADTKPIEQSNKRATIPNPSAINSADDDNSKSKLDTFTKSFS